MLKLTVELYPGGDKDKSEVLSIIDIWNTGKVLDTEETVYDYKGFMTYMNGETEQIKGTVNHWRPHVLWILLYEIIKKELLKKVKDESIIDNMELS